VNSQCEAIVSSR